MDPRKTAARVAALFAPKPVETAVPGTFPAAGVRDIAHDKPGDN